MQIDFSGFVKEQEAKVNFYIKTRCKDLVRSGKYEDIFSEGKDLYERIADDQQAYGKTQKTQRDYKELKQRVKQALFKYRVALLNDTRIFILEGMAKLQALAKMSKEDHPLLNGLNQQRMCNERQTLRAEITRLTEIYKRHYTGLHSEQYGGEKCWSSQAILEWGEFHIKFFKRWNLEGYLSKEQQGKLDKMRQKFQPHPAANAAGLSVIPVFSASPRERKLKEVVPVDKVAGISAKAKGELSKAAVTLSEVGEKLYNSLSELVAHMPSDGMQPSDASSSSPPLAEFKQVATNFKMLIRIMERIGSLLNAFIAQLNDIRQIFTLHYPEGYAEKFLEEVWQFDFFKYLGDFNRARARKCEELLNLNALLKNVGEPYLTSTTFLASKKREQKMSATVSSIQPKGMGFLINNLSRKSLPDKLLLSTDVVPKRINEEAWSRGHSISLAMSRQYIKRALAGTQLSVNSASDSDSKSEAKDLSSTNSDQGVFSAEGWSKKVADYGAQCKELIVKGEYERIFSQGKALYDSFNAEREALQEPYKQFKQRVVHALAQRKQDADGNTLLHVAVESGSVEDIRKCLENGARIDVYNKDGQCAMDLSGPNGDDILEQLRLRLIHDDSEELTDLIKNLAGRMLDESWNQLKLKKSANVVKSSSPDESVSTEEAKDSDSTSSSVSIYFSADVTDIEVWQRKIDAYVAQCGKATSGAEYERLFSKAKTLCEGLDVNQQKLQEAYKQPKQGVIRIMSPLRIGLLNDIRAFILEKIVELHALQAVPEESRDEQNNIARQALCEEITALMLIYICHYTERNVERFGGEDCWVSKAFDEWEDFCAKFFGEWSPEGHLSSKQKEKLATLRKDQRASGRELDLLDPTKMIGRLQEIVYNPNPDRGMGLNRSYSSKVAGKVVAILKADATVKSREEVNDSVMILIDVGSNLFTMFSMLTRPVRPVKKEHLATGLYNYAYSFMKSEDPVVSALVSISQLMPTMADIGPLLEQFMEQLDRMRSAFTALGAKNAAEEFLKGLRKHKFFMYMKDFDRARVRDSKEILGLAGLLEHMGEDLDELLESSIEMIKSRVGVVEQQGMSTTLAKQKKIGDLFDQLQRKRSARFYPLSTSMEPQSLDQQRFSKDQKDSLVASAVYLERKLYVREIGAQDSKSNPLSQFATYLEQTKPNVARIDVQDSKGDTLLHIAVRQGWIGKIKKCLESGARTDIRNAAGQRAVDLKGPQGENIFHQLMRTDDSYGKDIKPYDPLTCSAARSVVMNLEKALQKQDREYSKDSKSGSSGEKKARKSLATLQSEQNKGGETPQQMLVNKTELVILPHLPYVDCMSLNTDADIRKRRKIIDKQFKQAFFFLGNRMRVALFAGDTSQYCAYVKHAARLRQCIDRCAFFPAKANALLIQLRQYYKKGGDQDDRLMTALLLKKIPKLLNVKNAAEEVEAVVRPRSRTFSESPGFWQEIEGYKASQQTESCQGIMQRSEVLLDRADKLNNAHGKATRRLLVVQLYLREKSDSAWFSCDRKLIQLKLDVINQAYQDIKDGRNVRSIFTALTSKDSELANHRNCLSALFQRKTTSQKLLQATLVFDC